jgi:hypothetical protein
MAVERIGEMTLEELRQIIREEIEARAALSEPHLSDQQSFAETLEWFRHNRWSPPPGAPSTLELLREDRDQ